MEMHFLHFINTIVLVQYPHFSSIVDCWKLVGTVSSSISSPS